jgi:pyruvate,water dikinase
MSSPASAPLSSAPLSSAPLPAAALLAGVRELFTATAEYYNVAQSATIPLSMMSEGVFSAFYNKLVKRKGDPQAASFLFGEENLALSAEKALYDLAVWVKAQPGLADQVLNTPADGLVSALQAVPAPDDSFAEFATRFTAYLGQYGHAIYDLDFAKPVPAEAPAPLLETLKLYMRGEHNPYERQRLALERRTQAAEAASRRLGPLRRRWFRQLLHWAQDTAPLREDSIANLGLGHPQIRRLLSELGRRLAASGAIAAAEDVYWLEAEELDRMAGLLDKGEPLPDHCPQVERRKTKWQAMRRITPPNTIPAKSFMARFYPSQDQPGDTIKGFGASAGRVTARACVMLGPEDFHRLRPGDVIVAGITTPAWTPLFARAAAIVTDIGGPLSHSSIVAREYGIPAVLATGNGTRRIQDGQMITVDGSAGLVTIPK